MRPLLLALLALLIGVTPALAASRPNDPFYKYLGSLRYAVTSLKKGRCTLRAKLNAPGPYEDASLNVSIQVR